MFAKKDRKIKSSPRMKKIGDYSDMNPNFSPKYDDKQAAKQCNMLTS